MRDYARLGYLLVRRYVYRSLYRFFKTRYYHAENELLNIAVKMDLPKRSMEIVAHE